MSIRIKIILITLAYLTWLAFSDTPALFLTLWKLWNKEAQRERVEMHDDIDTELVSSMARVRRITS